MGEEKQGKGEMRDEYVLFAQETHAIAGRHKCPLSNALRHYVGHQVVVLGVIYGNVHNANPLIF